MKRISTLFLQAVLVLVGLVALFILIRFPLTEGRAKDLDLLSIYLDPFILYAYATSVLFFIALYKAFRLLGYISQNKLFSMVSVSALRCIKYCAILFGVLVAVAGLYIRFTHNKDDDPAGFVALSIVVTFISVAVAVAVAVLEKILKNVVDMKTENDLTI